MYRSKKVTAIIPALNEEASIGKVLGDLPEYVDQTIVCDNGSTDGTAEVARRMGALVVHESERGYGAACLKALKSVDPTTDIIVFLDADYSDYPEETSLLLDPIIDENRDIVIGSRMLGADSRKILTPVARFGNWLSTFLIRMCWGYRFTDLGPFRAVTKTALDRLQMRDRNFGWTVELQIKAAKLRMNATEVKVSYRERIGQSKISGTIGGSIKAGTKILYLIFREVIR